MEAWSQSLREALKANPSASSKDRRTLNEAVIQLEAQQQKLEDADLQALAESTVVAAKTQLQLGELGEEFAATTVQDRKSTRLNSSHVRSSYAVFCLKKKRQIK